MRFTLYYYHFLLQALIMSLSPSHVLFFNLRTHLLIIILILYHTPSATKRKIKKIVDINLYVDNHKVYECT